MIFFQKPVSTFWDRGPKTRKAAPALFRPVAALSIEQSRTLPRAPRKPLAFPVVAQLGVIRPAAFLSFVGTTVLRGLVLAGPAVFARP
jgi:hypothetical protein